MADPAPSGDAPGPGRPPPAAPSRLRWLALTYAFANAVGRGTSLAIVPVLFLLPLETVGRWALLAAVRAVAASICGFSLDGWTTQVYHRLPAGDRDHVAAAAVKRCAGWNALIALLAAPAFAWPAARPWIAIVWSGQALAVMNTAASVARIAERPRRFLALSLPGGLATVALAWGLVAGAHAGVWGLIMAFTLPPLVTAIAAVATAGDAADARWDGYRRYALTVHASRILTDVYGQADRLVLGAMLDAAGLGVYEIATRLASPATLAWGSYKSAVLPEALRRLAEDRAGARCEERFLAGWLAGTATALAMHAAVAVAAWWRPEGSWAAALPLLPLAAAVQAWIYAQSYFGAFAYHLRLEWAQAWLPIATLIAVGGCGWCGAWVGAARGALAGFLLAQVLSSWLSAGAVRRAWPEYPRPRRLVACCLALSAYAAATTFLPPVGAAIAATAAAAPVLLAMRRR